MNHFESTLKLLHRYCRRYKQEPDYQLFIKCSSRITKKTLPRNVIHVIERNSGISYSRLKSPDRHEPVRIARQVAMYLLHYNSKVKKVEIAQMLNRKAHGTVINAIYSVEDAIFTKNEEYTKLLNKCIKSLN